MKKQIHFLLTIIGILLVTICPVYAEMLPDEAVADTIQNESETDNSNDRKLCLSGW